MLTAGIIFVIYDIFESKKTEIQNSSIEEPEVYEKYRDPSLDLVKEYTDVIEKDYPLSIASTAEGIYCKSQSQKKKFTLTFNFANAIATEINTNCTLFLYHGISQKEFGLIKITEENLLSKSKESLGSGDFKTGDREFDDAMLLKSGNKTHFISLLPSHIRSKLISLTEKTSNLEISNSWIRVNIPINKMNGETFEKVFQDIVTISNSMSQKITITQRSIEALKNENNEATMIMMLDAISINKLTVEEKDSLLPYLKHKSLDVQIATAYITGDKGAHHIANLITSNKNLSEKQILKITTILLNNKNRKHLSIIKNIYIETSSKEIKVNILNKLLNYENKDIITFIQQEIPKEKNQHILLILIKILGSIGTRDDVMILKNCESIHKTREIKNACQKSIGEIQSHMSGADAGMVTMAGSTEKEGGISISNKDEGKISLTEEG